MNKALLSSQWKNVPEHVVQNLYMALEYFIKYVKPREDERPIWPHSCATLMRTALDVSIEMGSLKLTTEDDNT